MKTAIFATAAILLAACSDAQSPVNITNNADFSAHDRLGGMNHLSAEKTAEAAKLITTGKTYPIAAKV